MGHTRPWRQLRSIIFYHLPYLQASRRGSMIEWDCNRIGRSSLQTIRNRRKTIWGGRCRCLLRKQYRTSSAVWWPMIFNTAARSPSEVVKGFNEGSLFQKGCMCLCNRAPVLFGEERVFNEPLSSVAIWLLRRMHHSSPSTRRCFWAAYATSA